METDTAATTNTLTKHSTALLLDVKAVAALLDCSPRTVYRLADWGKMPRPLKLGAMVRWKRADLEAWVAEGCRPVRDATVRRCAR
jgi:excisionase family DNA binding protein